MANAESASSRKAIKTAGCYSSVFFCCFADTIVEELQRQPNLQLSMELLEEETEVDLHPRE